MDILMNALPYLKDPLVVLGFVMFLAFLIGRQFWKSGVMRPLPNSPGSRIPGLTLGYGFILGLLVMAAGGYLKHLELHAINAAVESERGDGPREVDFGFAELDPGQPVPIPSYKNGGTMVLYSGEQFEFHALSDGPLPPIELHAGNHVQILPGAEGKVVITGPSNQPLPALLLARGSRVSLPGSAPPRVAVKVRVFGVARPK